MGGIEVWWIRHGESVRNAGLPTVDTYSAAMTRDGHDQALLAAQALPGRPDLLVHSSFLRARQTAEPMRERFPGVACEEWDVHEYHFLCDDQTRNTTRVDREPMVHKYWERCDPDHVEGVRAESFRGFVERVDRNVARLRSCDRRWVVVCTHQHFMLGVLLRLEDPASPVDRDLMRRFRSLVVQRDVPNGALIRTVLQRGSDASRIAPVLPVGTPWGVPDHFAPA